MKPRSIHILMTVAALLGLLALSHPAAAERVSAWSDTEGNGNNAVFTIPAGSQGIIETIQLVTGWLPVSGPKHPDRKAWRLVGDTGVELSGWNTWDNRADGNNLKGVVLPPGRYELRLVEWARSDDWSLYYTLQPIGGPPAPQPPAPQPPAAQPPVQQPPAQQPVPQPPAAPSTTTTTTTTKTTSTSTQATTTLQTVTGWGQSQITIPPGATTVPPGATTVAPGTTTVPPGATTVPPGAITLPPGATTIPPGATTVPPGAATIPPGATTVPPGAATVPPGATTIPPGATTLPPGATTIPPGATTVPPGATTVPPGATTIPPGTTTVPPAGKLTPEIVAKTVLIDKEKNLWRVEVTLMGPPGKPSPGGAVTFSASGGTFAQDTAQTAADKQLQGGKAFKGFLLEGGQPQNISVSYPGDPTYAAVSTGIEVPPRRLARSTVFVVDASGSMKGQRLASAKQAVRQALSGYPAGQNQEEWALWVFFSCKDIRLLQPFTTDPGRVVSRLDFQASGSTPIAASLNKAGTYLRQYGAGAQGRIILLSDGQETCGGKPVDVAQDIRGKTDLVLIGGPAGSAEPAGQAQAAQPDNQTQAAQPGTQAQPGAQAQPAQPAPAGPAGQAAGPGRVTTGIIEAYSDDKCRPFCDQFNVPDGATATAVMVPHPSWLPCSGPKHTSRVAWHLMGPGGPYNGHVTWDNSSSSDQVAGATLGPGNYRLCLNQHGNLDNVQLRYRIVGGLAGAPLSTERVGASSDSGCNFTEGRFTIPAGRTARNLMVDVSTNWQPCDGAAKVDRIGWRLEDSGKQSLATGYMNWDNRANSNTAVGLALPPGDYTLVLIRAGKETGVTLTYELW